MRNGLQFTAGRFYFCLDRYNGRHLSANVLGRTICEPSTASNNIMASSSKVVDPFGARDEFQAPQGKLGIYRLERLEAAGIAPSPNCHSRFEFYLKLH
jgi:hypothetical protein